MKTQSLQKVIAKLEELFSIFNEHYYGGELQTPVITVSPDTTRGAYGWCTSWHAWKKTGEEAGYYEINICAEHLARPFFDVCETLIHEMVHLHNLQIAVKDTSRSGTYHNAKFKKAAEEHGLVVEKTAKSGWSYTKLSEASEEWLTNKFGDEAGFALSREKLAKSISGAKKSSSRKYVCRGCGISVRATKEVAVVCAECEEVLVQE